MDQQRALAGSPARARDGDWTGRVASPVRSRSSRPRAGTGPRRSRWAQALSLTCRTSRSITEARRSVPATSWPKAVSRRTRSRSTSAPGVPGRADSLVDGGFVMIRANTRGRLTAADLQLVILLLSRGSAHRRAYLERRLTTEGPDSLLDAPDLLERLLTVRSMLLPSEALFFYVLVRHALRRSGLEERDLADYLAALLLEFGQRDRAWRVDWNDDQQTPLSGRHPGRPGGHGGRPPLQGDGPPGELRALAERAVSRLYRRSTTAQSGAGRELLRCAGQSGLWAGVRPCRWPKSTASGPCSELQPTGSLPYEVRSTA